MPPKKNENAKKESGRAKKAENEAKKSAAAAAVAERKEAETWAEGTRSSKSKEDKEAKRQAELARKAENARILAEEEAGMTSKKLLPKAGTKKKVAPKPAGPGAIAAGGPSSVQDGSKDEDQPHATEVESFAASGLDDALELLSIVNQKADKASIGQAAANIEQHPERRFKAAFEAYSERELSNLKVDRPGLRLQQYKELLYKQFQKSPDNPFNQTRVGYDATKEEKVEALKKSQAETESRLRE
ncbi:hypothetical protein FRC02_010521 [Tulasnella sp. 418]|nr:hypothetical protein FRC02_010521 [Tulasnella sp. 418]